MSLNAIAAMEDVMKNLMTDQLHCVSNDSERAAIYENDYGTIIDDPVNNVLYADWRLTSEQRGKTSLLASALWGNPAKRSDNVESWRVNGVTVNIGLNDVSVSCCYYRALYESSYEEDITGTKIEIGDLEAKYPGAFEALVREYENQCVYHHPDDFKACYGIEPAKFNAREFTRGCQFVEVTDELGVVSLVSRFADSTANDCEDITWDASTMTWQL